MSEALWDVVGVVYVAAAAAFGIGMAVLGFWVTDRAVTARGMSIGWAFLVAMAGGFLTFAGGWLVLLPYLSIRWLVRRFGGPGAPAVPDATA